MQSLWMLVASLLFASMGVCVKLAAQTHSAVEITFYRSFVSLFLMYGLVRLRGVRLATPQWRWQISRGVVGFSALFAMFILPYLKDKTATPVMFNGVNAAAEKYGFPNAHVSGVLERAHVRESLAFIKQILPSVRKACFMTADVPPGRALRSQVDAEKATYPISTSDFYLIRDNQQLEGLGKSLNANCDLLFVDSLEGILDAIRQLMTPPSEPKKRPIGFVTGEK